jgi:hypothetical protein
MHPAYGYKHTEACILKNSLSKMGKNNPNFGKKFTKAEIKKRHCNAIKKGRPFLCLNDGNIYKGIRNVSRFLDIPCRLSY